MVDDACQRDTIASVARPDFSAKGFASMSYAVRATATKRKICRIVSREKVTLSIRGFAVRLEIQGHPDPSFPGIRFRIDRHVPAERHHRRFHRRHRSHGPCGSISLARECLGLRNLRRETTKASVCSVSVGLRKRRKLIAVGVGAEAVDRAHLAAQSYQRP